ncbi:hypothetical protein DTO271G3_3790 [Paecilomyces variotii]|nr:hypothetical protein DTO271G3_3790 [Paecilomyces variotii]
MVAYYQIAGKKVGSHYLAMGVLGAIFGTTYLATRGGAAKNTAQGPPINAASKDEEQFIQDFLKNVDGGSKAASH